MLSLSTSPAQTLYAKDCNVRADEERGRSLGTRLGVVLGSTCPEARTGGMDLEWALARLSFPVPLWWANVPPVCAHKIFVKK